MSEQQIQNSRLHWLGRQLFNREDPAAYLDLLLERINPMWVQGYTPARVEQIIQETADTRTFVLKPSRRWSGFQAGQHVNIGTDVNGVRQHRTFSLSSSPELWQQQGLITLTIKRLPGGLVTNWLHDHLETGSILGLGDAFGDFLLPESGQPVLFIAGGSGITPILSQLETMVAQDYLAPVTLLYYVRTQADIIARDRLEAMASRLPDLTLNIITTHAQEQPRYLNEQDLEAVPELHARQVYLCGPGGLMDLASTLLNSQGIAEDRIHCTFFSAPVVDTENLNPGGLVHFGRSDLEVDSEGNANLLDIAEAAGLNLKHGCRMGICHQCSCRKSSGTVINTLTGKVSGPGEETVQLCISVPQGPVTLDI